MTVLDVLQPWRSSDTPPAFRGSVQTHSATTRTALETESSERDRDDGDEDGSADEAAESMLMEMSRKKPTVATTTPGSGGAAEPPSTCAKILKLIQQFRKLCGTVINDTRVQIFIVLLIAVNAIMLGIATFPIVKDNPEVSHKFEVTDKVFLIIFTIELGMQFIYRGLYLFLDGWLIFDFVIIVTSWSFAEVQIIRAFRIFRAFRLVTRVKVLQNLVIALFGVVPRMAAIGLLLLLIFFIFAILMTSMWKDLYHDGETSQDYFSRLDATFFTLFQMLTLDEWAGICREVMAVPEYSWAWLPIIAFIIITAFIVINLIIAVICDAISALHADQKAMIHGQSTDEMDDDDEEDDLDNLKDDRDSMNVKKQLEALERQVEELARMQQQTMHSLQYLTRHLQGRKLSKR